MSLPRLEKTRWSFGCGFCGSGNRLYVSIAGAMMAAQRHHCRSKMIDIYRSDFYVGYAKPVNTKVGA
jgi:hypothetical protein